jgi:hypothetical protein
MMPVVEDYGCRGGRAGWSFTLAQDNDLALWRDISVNSLTPPSCLVRVTRLLDN